MLGFISNLIEQGVSMNIKFDSGCLNGRVVKRFGVYNHLALNLCGRGFNTRLS